MNLTLLLLWLYQSSTPDLESQIRETIARVAHTARVQQIGSDTEKVSDPTRSVAPGAPPLLSFRYFAGSERHRFGNLDLVIDDAGH
jgi:hypothetical protein